MVIEEQARSSPSEEILPFEMGYLPEFYQKKAETELHDTPENREKCLKLIKEMAREDKHLCGLEFDDDFLLQYLRGKKFNVAGAFSKLKAFANLRRKHPEMFTHLQFEPLSLGTRTKCITFLPVRCQDGCAILVGKLDRWDPEEFTVEHMKQYIVVSLLQSLRDPMTQVNGFKAIIDVNCNPLTFLRHITPSTIYLYYHGTQECVGGRFKEIHIVNNSLIFKTAWLFLKPFMTAKMKKRFIFHAEPDTLRDYFPRSSLPVEYGGNISDYDMTEWLRKVTQPERIATLGGTDRFSSSGRKSK